MDILEKSYQLSEKQTQTNIKIPFAVPGLFRQMKIHFEYSPEKSSDKVAQEQVQQAIENYIFDGAPADEYIVKNYLPIENFITLSVTKDDNYLGGHHNKKKEQVVILSEAKSSLGFWPTTIEPGNWELQLNCHCIASEHLEAHIRIEVIR